MSDKVIVGKEKVESTEFVATSIFTILSLRT